MAFPWVFEESFDDGTKGDFDTESDTGALLDFPHYTTLAAIPGMGLPFRGAYCMRILPGDANDHTLLEGDINITNAATGWVRFLMWHNLTATADDIFNIFEHQASATIEVVISLQITAATNLVEIGLGESEASVFNAILLPNQWNIIEMSSVAQTGATSTLYVNGASVQTLGSHPSAAVTDGVLGTQGTLDTTAGTLLFDQFVFDELQIYPFKRRFVEQVLVTKDQHLFVGNGRIDNVTLLSGDTTADNVLRIYDTDVADTNDASNIVVELRNTAVDETVDPAGMPVRVTRGAYITLTGTSSGRGPRALVQIGAAQGWGSDGAIRNYAAKRTS